MTVRKAVKTKDLPTTDPFKACTVPADFTGRLLGQFEDGSLEWTNERAGRIGASDIGVICGWSPFKTRAELLATKGMTRTNKQTKAMRRGHLLEPAIAEWFRGEASVHYLSGSDGTYVHPDNDWALANPDRICSDGTLLEIKSSADKSLEHGWGRAGTGQVPLLYQAQAVWQMYVTGLRVVNIAVLFGSPFEFAKYVVKWDPDVASYLVRQATTFLSELRARDLNDQETAA